MSNITHFHADDHMSLIVCDNPHMLSTLVRFNIHLGFADKSVQTVCEESNVDTNTFLAVVNVILSGDKSDHINYKNISADDLISYLQSSHKYMIGYKLPKIRRELCLALDNNVAPTMSKLVMRYFDEYFDEVRTHLDYEENTVFKYVKCLLADSDTNEYNINIFSEKHDNIDEKMSELKDIVIKYFPSKSTDELMEVLFDIFRCSDELLLHNMVEDSLLIPLVKFIEINK